MAKFTLSLDGPLIKIPDKIAGYSFDYVSRYQIIAEIIVRYEKFTGRKPRNVLDVGGLGSLLDKIHDVPVTILDSEAEDAEGKQQGDGARMENIPDGAFDIVVTSDTLEHIPRPDRKAFVRELFRVTNDLVILCAPFRDNGAAAEESKAQAFYTAFMGHPHRWLQEHAEFRIPAVDDVMPIFKECAKSVVQIGHDDVGLWRDLLSVSLVANDMGGEKLTAATAKINRYYNRTLLFKDFTSHSYRTFLIGSKKNDIAYTQSGQAISSEDKAGLDALIHDFYTTVFENAEQLPVMSARIQKLEAKVAETKQELEATRARYEHVIHSKTWRYTEPARNVVGKLKRNNFDHKTDK